MNQPQEPENFALLQQIQRSQDGIDAALDEELKSKDGFQSEARKARQIWDDLRLLKFAVHDRSNRISQSEA